MIPRAHSSCKIQVTNKGSWIGLGLADSKFHLSGGAVLGAQKGIEKTCLPILIVTLGCLNCSYFTQDGNTRIQMDGEQKIDLAKQPINVGDTVEIIVDFSANKITFKNNGQFVGTMAPTNVKLPEGQLHFCASLSAGTEVKFINHGSGPIPTVAPTPTHAPSPTHAPAPTPTPPVNLPPPSKACNKVSKQVRFVNNRAFREAK